MRRVSKSAICLLLACTFSPAFAADERTIVPNENLVAEGIPPVPASVAEEVGRYTEFRSASLASWHPVRREMLILTRFADVAQVHLVKIPGGARNQLTFFPERVQGASYQPTTGSYFVFSKDIGGNEFSQLYRFDPASARVTLLTDGKSRNEAGAWSNNGQWLAYNSTRRNGTDSDIYVVDPTNPDSNRKVAEVQGGGWGAAAWSPDDKKLLVFEFLSVNESYMYLVDVASGEKTLLTPKDGTKVNYGSGGAVFGKDGKGVYLTTDKDSEFQRLAYMDLATKRFTYLTDSIKWDVESIDLSDDGRSIVFASNEDGASKIRFLDTRTRKITDAPALPPGVVGSLAWRKNGKEVGLTISSARASTDVYSISVDKGTVTRWTESETGGLDTSSFSEPQLVRWKSFDGMMISGFLYRPPAKFTGKRPVVINIHGGPESQYRPGFLGRNNYFLNEMGVAMIFPNVRGSSGYGKTFLTLDNWEKREDSVKDIGALLDWIKTQPDLDSNRVLVQGGSYGGYMTLAVSTNYADRINCAIDVVGISNFVTFLEKTEGYRRDLRRVEYGDEREPKMREFLNKISPLTNANRITKPLFVIQGQNDPRVPLNEAEQIVATVKKSRTPVWYLMAKNEGHGFARKQNIDFQFYATILFMRENLLK